MRGKEGERESKRERGREREQKRERERAKERERCRLVSKQSFPAEHAKKLELSLSSGRLVTLLFVCK